MDLFMFGATIGFIVGTVISTLIVIVVGMMLLVGSAFGKSQE